MQKEMIKKKDPLKELSDKIAREEELLKLKRIKIKWILEKQ